MNQVTKQVLESHTLRQTCHQVDEVIKCLSLVQHSEVNENVAAVILLCKRTLAHAVDELNEMFGADWPENK
ncbi:hypothetical protein [Dryocola sp. LX212]